MRSLTRREFIEWMGFSGVGLAIAGCAPQTPALTPVPAATTAAPLSSATKTVPVLRLVGGDYGNPTPFAYSRGPGYVRMSLLFDTLVWKDSQGYIPWLATNWETADNGKQWTFTLRPGVKWHDGQALTVDDIVFTFQYCQSQPALVSLVRGIELLSDVRKLDAQRVEFVFSKPYAPFLSGIASATPIIPKHLWETVTDGVKFTQAQAFVGSGPYKLSSYDKATGAYLYQANVDFFLGAPVVQRIELVPVADALVALQKGTVDAADLPNDSPIPDEALAPFQTPEFGSVSAPGEWNTAIHFNLAKGAPYDNVKFRQAWAYAIDRADIVKRLLLGRGQPGVPVYLAPSNPWFNASAEKYLFDQAQAKALLDAAGYRDANDDGVRETPEGKPLEVPFLFNPTYSRAAELVRDFLKAVGVTLALKPVDGTTLDASTAAGNFEVALTYYGGLGGDPDGMRQNFSSKSQSKSFARAIGYANTRFDDLADQQLSESDEAKRRALVNEMQVILAQDVPVLPLYYPNRLQIYRKNVFDAWYYTPGGIGSGQPGTWNKQAFVTGRKTGTGAQP